MVAAGDGASGAAGAARDGRPPDCARGALVANHVVGLGFPLLSPIELVEGFSSGVACLTGACCCCCCCLFCLLELWLCHSGDVDLIGAFGTSRVLYAGAFSLSLFLLLSCGGRVK